MTQSDRTPSATQPDWARFPPRDAFREISRVLRDAMPPVPGGAAEAARRDRAAMAAVAGFLPENAAEVRLAAQFVAADAWAQDCLRLAGERRLEFNVSQKCRAQAASLMREGKSSLRLLLRLQAMRDAREADGGKADRAAWSEHCAMTMMAEGLEPAGPENEADAPADAAAKMIGEPEAASNPGSDSENETSSPDTARETESGLPRGGEAALAVLAIIRGTANPRSRSLRDLLMGGGAGRLDGGPPVRGGIVPTRQAGTRVGT